LTKLKEGESSHRWPQFLPDGNTVLFTAVSGGSLDDAQIAAQPLDSAEHRVLLQGGTYARYVPTGHLVYYRAGTMMAVPFDPVRLEVRGTPAPVLEGIMASVGSFGGEVTPVWVDRKGAVQPLEAPPRIYQHPHLSPDGQKLAVTIQGAKDDIWVYDFPRRTLTRLTLEGFNHISFWTPDGKAIVFRSIRPAGTNFFGAPADGASTEEQLTRSITDNPTLSSVSPDGKLAFYSVEHPTMGRDIWVASLDGERNQSVLLQTPFDEVVPKISPDGRWLAYLSNESDRFEVYVRAFPGPGGRWQISTDGAVEPLWARNGRELFYRAGDKVMAVDITTQPSFQAGSPRLLFEGDYTTHNAPPEPNYDVSPDGQRFLMFKAQEEQHGLTQIHVVLNWFEELKRRVPTGR
jgi:serine/threonine-protein kinase